MKENQGNNKGSEENKTGQQENETPDYEARHRANMETIAELQIANQSLTKKVAINNDENAKYRLKIKEMETAAKASLGKKGKADENTPDTEKVAREAYDKGVASLQGKYDDAVAAAQKASAGLQSYAINSAFNGAMAAGGYKHPDMVLAVLTGENRPYDYVFEDGAVAVKYKAGHRNAGQRVTSERGGFMGINEVVLEYVTDRPDLIPSTKHSGSGSTAGNKINNSTLTPDDIKRMSLEEFNKRQSEIIAAMSGK